MTERLGLGTQLRHMIDVLDGDVAKFQADLGLTDVRPRYTPVVRALVSPGPMSIRDLAAAVQMTHSAASQTANHTHRAGLVSLAPGSDARQRILSLTAKSRAMLPALEREWAATEAATGRARVPIAGTAGRAARGPGAPGVPRSHRRRRAERCLTLPLGQVARWAVSKEESC